MGCPADHSEAAFYAGFKPVDHAPVLRRVNGFGLGVYGWLTDQRLPRGHIKLYFITALWLPILPLCGYLVEGTFDEFRFFKRISLWNLVKLFRGRVILLYLSALIGGAGVAVIFLAMIVLIVCGLSLIRSHF